MNVRRLAACALSGVLLTAGGTLVAGPASAVSSAGAAPTPSLAAATYPPVDQTIGLDPSDPRTGQDVTVTASGFKPLSAATVTTSPQGGLGTGRSPGSVAAAGEGLHVYPATADSTGVVTTVVRFDEPGAHTVTVSGITPTGVTRSVSTSVDVAPATVPGSGGATTPGTVPGAGDEESSNLLEYGAAGAAVLVLGGLGFLLARSRRSRKATGPARTAMPPTGPAHPAPASAAAYPSGHPSTQPQQSHPLHSQPLQSQPLQPQPQPQPLQPQPQPAQPTR